MKCLKCQFDNPEGISFCGECGAKLERTCPKCNFSNPLEFKFCGKCGQDLSPPQLVPKRSSSDATEKNHRPDRSPSSIAERRIEEETIDEKPERPSAQIIYRRPPAKRMKPWSSWPNLSFICLFPIALVISFGRYGWSLYSVGFCLGWSMLPLLLVIRYNSIEGEHRASRNASIIVNILVFLLVSIGSTYNEFKKVTSPAKSVQREINTNITESQSSGPGTSLKDLWERADPRKDVDNISEQQSQTESVKSSRDQLQNNSEKANYFFSQGDACSSTKRYTEAIDNYNKAILLNPNFAVAYANRGAAYYYKGQLDQAISDNTKALEINPRDAVVYNNRGNAYGKKGQHDQAISDYNKALEISPSLADAHCNRGVTYFNKGQHDQAISDYNKAIEINPRYAYAYCNRGIAYYFKKEYDKSWDDIKKAQELGYPIPSKFLDDLRKASGREK